ncbi:hypothetical protein PGUG_01266 [Meyerozyma guilliermondii ATCC 6260]|uniref:MPN domain-containing protein n=1 Tax=Meyerozyma guilliermondii (strain ATCC 6260 / CBS 566 / DSM 6381 / JCM 1539 / NBRC 10279 / NRRL Y-324) TaxID=294746 RepID=A5DDB5_PICGU|nr:uncharacterized protein PGUG_01266 [Meyerozyma guilliermondii ATCC 6260]EDK37168.2 hypothetical protein PGUG_01266 [Meyerozyma guilliermondii ATCC 6260]
MLQSHRGTLSYQPLFHNLHPVFDDISRGVGCDSQRKKFSYFFIMADTPSMHLVRPTVAALAASSASGPCKIKVHNVALFKILEIVAKQVHPDHKRVIGTMLGYRSEDGTEFEIRDAFMVPCTETGESLAIDDQAHKTFYKLYKKAHPKEYVLGWFGSGKQIDTTTGLIHDFYSKGADSAAPYPAIHLNVDFVDDDQNVTAPSISTYIGAAIGRPASGKIGWKTSSSSNNSYIFTPIPHEIITGSVTEKLALNGLCEAVQIGTESGASSVSGAAASDLSYLSSQLNAVSATITKLLHHIESPSTSDADVDLLRLLSNNLLTKPHFLTDVSELKSHFMAHNQDVIMIEYLTKVVKEQIELSARLTAGAESKYA